MAARALRVQAQPVLRRRRQPGSPAPRTEVQSEGHHLQALVSRRVRRGGPAGGCQGCSAGEACPGPGLVVLRCRWRGRASELRYRCLSVRLRYLSERLRRLSELARGVSGRVSGPVGRRRVELQLLRVRPVLVRPVLTVGAEPHQQHDHAHDRDQRDEVPPAQRPVSCRRRTPTAMLGRNSASEQILEKASLPTATSTRPATKPTSTENRAKYQYSSAGPGPRTSRTSETALHCIRQRHRAPIHQVRHRCEAAESVGAGQHDSPEIGLPGDPSGSRGTRSWARGSGTVQ